MKKTKYITLISIFMISCFLGAYVSISKSTDNSISTKTMEPREFLEKKLNDLNLFENLVIDEQ